MPKSLQIQFFSSGKATQDLRVSIPLSMVNLAARLLPVRVKLFLENEGIDIAPVAEMPSIQKHNGELIEIESADGKMVILVEDATRKQ